jgi:hypothetical protein
MKAGSRRMHSSSRRRFYEQLLFFLLMTTALLVLARRAEAATINVGPTCTIRNAIESANSNTATGGCTAGTAGLDTVVIPAGTYTLTVPDNSTYWPTAFPVVVEDLILQGAGSAVTKIERASNAVLEFNFLVVWPNMVDLTISGITFHNGKDSGTGSGAFHVLSGGDVVFDDVVVTDTTCLHWACTVSAVSLTVTDSQFSNNQCAQGVLGVSNSFALTPTTISGSVISNNASGSVWLLAATVTNTQFLDNAGPTPLGIGTGTVTDCEFSNNDSTASPYGDAGAIATSHDGPLLIENSTFLGNSALNGGAIFVGFNSSAPVTIDGCTFTANSAVPSGGSGGAIHVQANQGEVTVTGSTFQGNSAYYGGAIVSNTGITINDSVFIVNDATPGIGMSGSSTPATESGTPGQFSVTAAANGSALYVAGGFTTVTNSCFVADRAYGVSAVGAGVVIAQGNWWGSPSGAATTLGGGVEIVSSQVDYSSPLAAAPFPGCSPFAPPPNKQVNVLISGSATNGIDYQTLSSPVAVPWNGLAQVTVNPVNDALVEGQESVSLTVDSPSTQWDYVYDPQAVPSWTIFIDDDGTGCVVDGDCADPGECLSPDCVGGACLTINDPAGTPCATGVCDGAAACVECVGANDCQPGEICDLGTNTCIPDPGTGGGGGGGPGGGGQGGAGGGEGGAGGGATSTTGSGGSGAGATSGSGGGGEGGFDSVDREEDDEGCDCKCMVGGGSERIAGRSLAWMGFVAFVALRRRGRGARASRT